MPRKVYATEEERIQARRTQQAARRRRLGIPEKKKYNSDEERKKARNLQRRDYDKERRKQYKEKRYEQYKKWKENNREKVRELNQRSRSKLKHTPKALARAKRAYWNKKEKHRIRHSIYNKKNKDLLKVYSIKRRQMKKNVFESLSKKTIQNVYLKFNYKCYLCKNDNDLCIDHHYPLKQGNALTVDNAVLLCRSCNSIKRDKLPEYFYSPEQLTDLQDNYGITKQPLKIVEQPSLFPSWTTGNLERENDKVQAMNAA
jgi:hypothetical protein